MGGSFRFLQRVWALTQEYLAAGEGSDTQDADLQRIIHKATKRVSNDMATMGFNTSIAALMETVNDLYKHKASSPMVKNTPWKETIETLLQLLAPFAPHMTDELWEQLGHNTSVHTTEWPKYNEQYLLSDTMAIVVQVNGKVRSQLTVPSDAPEDVVVTAAKADVKIAAYLEGKTLKKTVYVPKKLVSFVV